MTVEEALSKIKSRVLSDESWAMSLDGSFGLRVSGASGGNWVFNCKDPVSVEEGKVQADCSCFVDCKDLVAIVSGELNPQVAYSDGRLRVEGDLILALKFSDLFGVSD